MPATHGSRGSLLLSIGFALLASALIIAPALATGTFTDDDGNIHEGAIEAIGAEGITKGCNPPVNDRYCPDHPVTRGQMAAFLRRAFKLPSTSTDSFIDDEDSVFEGDINALAQAGITKGCNPPVNDRYCPDGHVTRGQMAAFLRRAFDLPAVSTDFFTDDETSIFESDINAIAAEGITKGCNPPTNNRYCPDALVKRDQMASFLARALGLKPLPPPADVTDIDFWIAFSDYRFEYSQEKAAAFNEKHPEYNVRVTSFASYNDVFDAAILAVDSGEPPGLVHFFEVGTRQALDAVDGDGNPAFKSVTDAIVGRTEILGEPVVLDSVVDAARNYYTVDGSFYSMPWNTSTTVMFNNMDMLNAAGITEPPATWADVETACVAVMALDDAPSGCITWPNHSWFVEQSLGQQGELLGNNDNGRSDRATEVFLESDGMLAYLEWWKGLSDSGYYTYTGLQRDWDGTSNAFLAHEVAMLVYSSSDTTFFGNNADFTLSASFMPSNQDVDYVGNLIGGATIWMLDGMDEATEDGALAFLNFFSNAENAAAWHQLTGYVPITQDAVDLLEAEGWYDENPNSKVASDQLAAAQNTPASLGALLGNFVSIRDVITIAIEDILVNDKDVATRMAQANEEANTLLTEYEALHGG